MIYQSIVSMAPLKGIVEINHCKVVVVLEVARPFGSYRCFGGKGKYYNARILRELSSKACMHN